MNTLRPLPPPPQDTKYRVAASQLTGAWWGLVLSGCTSKHCLHELNTMGDD